MHIAIEQQNIKRFVKNRLFREACIGGQIGSILPAHAIKHLRHSQIMDPDKSTGFVDLPFGYNLDLQVHA
jgi:hypothetical protein